MVRHRSAPVVLSLVAIVALTLLTVDSAHAGSPSRFGGLGSSGLSSSGFRSPAGVWRGTWSSRSTGHQGPLRARIRQLDSHTYRAWFAGRFAGVIPFVYPSKLNRVPGTANLYQTSRRLPLMGNYRMTATVTPGRFDANFQSRNDQGTFRMTRRR